MTHPKPHRTYCRVPLDTVVTERKPLRLTYLQACILGFALAAAIAAIVFSLPMP